MERNESVRVRLWGFWISASDRAGCGNLYYIKARIQKSLSIRINMKIHKFIRDSLDQTLAIAEISHWSQWTGTRILSQYDSKGLEH